VHSEDAYMSWVLKVEKLAIISLQSLSLNGFSHGDGSRVFSETLITNYKTAF
jgi:hypothetical protein